MSWHGELHQQLSQLETWGYAVGGPGFTEPTALACLALHQLGDMAAAGRAADQLLEAQAEDGGVGICPGQKEPGWPTGWALVAWSQGSFSEQQRWRQATHAGVQWLTGLKGETLEPSDILGHDVTLIGWPWVRGTHSWVEPTAIAILGLRAAGAASDARVTEAERLLVNRQLPGGGCNYGNTIVLEQTLLPHGQPTALALLSLATPAWKNHPAVLKSRAYLNRQWPTLTGISTICYAALALTAHDLRPPDVDERLRQLFEDAIAWQADSGYALALIALAATESRLFTGTDPGARTKA